MLNEWLRTLSDEQLLTWSSRGQMRRAAKLLEACNLQQVMLHEEWAEAAIDGHRQALRGVGFEGVNCSCPSTGLCHHLVCFVLALRTKASAVAQIPGSAAVAPAATAPEPYWRVVDDGALLKALGRPHVRAAQRALAEGVDVQWQESASELVATVDDDAPVTVHLPALGHLAAAVCGCKKPACMHRALAVLAVRQHLGLTSAGHEFTLDDDQSATIDAAQSWLLEVACNGLVGLSSMHWVRGQALATELQQADLPRPGRALGAWVARHGEVAPHRGHRAHRVHRANFSDDASDAALGDLGEVWALLQGLRSQPMPRPLPELAGRHRRRYRTRQHLHLLTLGPEIWFTATGFRGYSIHFLDRDSQRYYSFSEARGPSQDRGWGPVAAMHTSALAGHAALSLQEASFTLAGAALSDDGRIAVRRATSLSDQLPCMPGEVLRASVSVASLRARFADAIEDNPLASPGEQMVLLRCQQLSPPLHDPYRGRWLSHCVDGRGDGYEVTTESRQIAQRLMDIQGTVDALLGRARLNGTAIELLPIIAYTMKGSVPLTAAA